MSSLLSRSARSAFRSASTAPSTAGGAALTSAAAASALLPTSPAAKLILSRAGFDTPIAHAQQSAGITTPAVTSGCPVSGASASLVASGLPSIFSASARCPCGLYPQGDVPQDCPSALAHGAGGDMAAKKHRVLPLAGRINPSASVRMHHSRAFSSVAAPAAAGVSGGAAARKAQSDSTPATSAAAASATSASTAAATPAAAPSHPPAVHLPACLSGAHSALLAIDDYRSGVQSLSKGSLSAAKGLLLRTKDIVSYVPGQPWMGVYTRHLLAGIAETEGKWKEERVLRAEALKEVEKIWGKPTSVSAVASDVLAAAALLSSAHALACLRADARPELRAMVEAWLPRVEALLFGRPPSPAAGIKQQPFTTGATHLKLLAFYGNLLQVALMERTTRPAATAGPGVEVKQPIFLRSIQQLSKVIAARPHLQSSLEWKLFQGELLLLPLPTSQPAIPPVGGVASTVLDLEGFVDLLPTVGGAESTGAPSSAHLHRAVRYFTCHPELNRLPLSESNLVREWYSPMLQAMLMAAEEGMRPATSADQPTAAAAAVDAQMTPSALLHSALAFVESTLSSDPSSVALLRTLLPLARLSIDEGEAIAAEGLLRNIVGKVDAMLGFSSGELHLDAGGGSMLMELYLDAVCEHAALLTRLEWNKVSRQAEAKAVLLQRLYQPARKDHTVRQLMDAILRAGATRRRFVLPATREALPQHAAEVTDEMVELPIVHAQEQQKRVPQWLQEKLHVSSGVA